MDTKTNELLREVKAQLVQAHARQNIANSERLLSVAAGAFVFYSGIVSLFKTPLTALAEVTVGSALILRGATGYCPVKDTLERGKEVTVVEHRFVEA